jgi:hypothetical protein
MLEEALRKTGANVIQTRSFWLFRPNDEARMNEPNRHVALQIAKQFGVESGQMVLASSKKSARIQEDNQISPYLMLHRGELIN